MPTRKRPLSDRLLAHLPADVRSQLPPDAYNRLEDPTLGLDKASFETVEAEILALPDGQAILDRAIAAQKDAVASAIDRLFLGTTIAGAVILILVLTLEEIPLRNRFATADEGDDDALLLAH